MTGYAVVTRETVAGTLTIELKSVNSRFLDLQFRMNDDLRALEPGLREAIMARVTRGKLECRVSIGQRGAVPGTTGAAPQTLNGSALASLMALQIQVRAAFVDAPPLTVAEVLRWPGMIEEGHLSEQPLQEEVFDAMQKAMSAFVDSRTREGAALRVALESRVDELQTLVARITPLVPQVVAQFQQKAVERMQAALGLALSISGPAAVQTSREDVLDRIRQEVTLYGIRIDVSEELTRLATHLAETRQLLQKGGQVGKRLDFMMQELNREANTVGSKASVRELSDASMSMKLLIEQMREQVQNLE
ncbi:MAG: YicC/YloC family endoribonuclease [Pseudomonadota bacterium]